MHRVGILALAAVLVLVAGPSFAQVISAPGTYPASVAIDTSLLPFPVPGLPSLGPNVYDGEVTITAKGFGSAVHFEGVTSDGLRLRIQARFGRGWFGLTLAPVMVDGQLVPDAVVRLDGASLLGMRINGVGTVDGQTAKAMANLGRGGELKNFKVTPQ